MLRQQLLGDGAPRYRYTVWRGFCDEPAEAAGLGWGCETLGRGDRFGLAPMHGGRVLWFATANRPEGERDPSDPRPSLLRRFAGWHEPIERVIAATPPERILRNDVYDRRPARAWTQGRVSLLGDAAHPMTPDLGQGACQAIEDAGVLADALGSGGPVQVALAEYERIRRPRTRAVGRTVGAFARMAQLKHPTACRVRDRMLRSLPPTMRARQLNLLLGDDEQWRVGASG